MYGTQIDLPMSGATFKDHFSGHSFEYARCRPRYPDGLFEYLASVAPSTGLAWDCATGSGQAAVSLAGHFDRVIATDASRQQLDRAKPHERVAYQAAQAECTQIASSSVDLVTVAQALHWFDIPAFFDEAKRVLKPDGVIAVWCYSWVRVDPVVNEPISRLYQDLLGPHWPPERRLVQEGYRNVVFPFDELSSPPFEMTVNWSLEEFIGYLRTWCAVGRYQQYHSIDPVGLVMSQFNDTWGDPAMRRKVSWDFSLRVGILPRLPSS